MNKWIVLLALAAVHAQTCLAGAADLEIVYPADKTVVSRSDYLIIKGGDQPVLDAMVITVNGVASDPIDISGADYRAAFQDILILQPEFDAGKNRVEVAGLVQGKAVAKAAAELFYQKDPVASPPADYVPFRMHTVEREAKCAGCHNMTPDKVELQQPDPAKNPCGSCHRRMLNHKYVHGPAGAMQCVSCHDPQNVEGVKYGVSSDEAAMCGECHKQQAKTIAAYAYVHGPVAAGLCLVCHDAHASDYPAQLLGKTNALCLGCHEAVRGEVHVARGIYNKSHPLEGVDDPQHPTRELSCASCHQPHGGAGPEFFAGNRTQKFALCQACHQK